MHATPAEKFRGSLNKVPLERSSPSPGSITMGSEETSRPGLLYSTSALHESVESLFDPGQFYLPCHRAPPRVSAVLPSCRITYVRLHRAAAGLALSVWACPSRWHQLAGTCRAGQPNGVDAARVVMLSCEQLHLLGVQRAQGGDGRGGGVSFDFCNAKCRALGLGSDLGSLHAPKLSRWPYNL